MNSRSEKYRYASSYELISLYINEYYKIDDETKRALAAEFKARKLPLPKVPQMQTAGPVAGGADSVMPSEASKHHSMDKRTFRSYLLFIYIVTAIFYAWVFIPARLLKRDYLDDKKDFHIQTALSIFFMALDIAAFFVICHALRR